MQQQQQVFHQFLEAAHGPGTCAMLVTALYLLHRLCVASRSTRCVQLASCASAFIQCCITHLHPAGAGASRIATLQHLELGRHRLRAQAQTPARPLARAR
jgi:hypothetical protein